jgi:hypothetical protein
MEAEQRICVFLSHLSGRSGQQKLPKIYIKYRFNKKTQVRQKTVLLQTCHNSKQILRTRHLILRDRMNFFPLTEPNVTDSLRHR